MGTGDFFSVLGPVFRSNSKWSIEPNVPALGTNEDPYEVVEQFYNFWRNFKTWREYTAGEEEFKLDDAETREEKRWMERQNKKLTKQLKKEEYSRLMAMVELAYKNDPRVARWRKEQEEEKQRKKDERKAAKRARKEEAEREVREEQERKAAIARAEEEAKDAAKKDAAAQNKQLRKKRPLLRKACRAARDAHDENKTKNPFNPQDEHVEALCKFLDLPQMNKLLRAFKDGNGPHEFRDMLVLHKLISADDVYFISPIEVVTVTKKPVPKPQAPVEKEQEQEPDKEEPTQVSNPKVWTPEEITALTKALAKFPVGTRDRYEKVAEIVSTRTVKEIIAQTNLAKSETAKEQVITKQDAFTRFKQTKKEPKMQNTSEPSPSVVETETQPTATAAPEEWSPDEQKLLEAAMKKYNAKETDRWTKIAGEVPGRSKADCVKRYKYLVEFFKQQQKK